jgi:hypothetical protein
VDTHIVERWQREINQNDAKRHLKAIRLRGLYEALAEQLFCQYEPTRKVSPRVSRDFLLRLDQWLENFDSDEDKWTAFRSIEYLFFAGQVEFDELYRCAHEHVLVRWLVELAELDIFSTDIEKKIERELNACWPCPITDSLRINSFLHITGIPGKSLRPDWTSLRTFACRDKIEAYKKRNEIKYLVLLEDFVGSGGQICRALKFAAEVYSGPILVVPLIVCEPGHNAIIKTLNNIERKDISYKPVLIIDKVCLIGRDVNKGEPKLFENLRNVMKEGYLKINDPLDGYEFGYGEVGSLVAMYSNCPNNTPPIFHHSNQNWTPIFPRSIRIYKGKP